MKGVWSASATTARMCASAMNWKDASWWTAHSTKVRRSNSGNQRTHSCGVVPTLLCIHYLGTVHGCEGEAAEAGCRERPPEGQSEKGGAK